MISLKRIRGTAPRARVDSWREHPSRAAAARTAGAPRMSSASNRGVATGPPPRSALSFSPSRSLQRYDVVVPARIARRLRGGRAACHLRLELHALAARPVPILGEPRRDLDQR